MPHAWCVRADWLRHRRVHRRARPAQACGLLVYLAAAAPRGFHRRDSFLALFWQAFYLWGHKYLLLHRYAEAVRQTDRALDLRPDLHSAALMKGHTYFIWHRQLETLRAVLNRVPTNMELWAAGTTDAQRAQLLLWDRQGDSLLQLLRTARVPVFDSYHFFVPGSLYVAWAHELLGDHRAGQAAFDSARALLDSVIRESPDDWRTHSTRGLALAGLGRHDDARREARWLQESFTYREDAVDHPVLAEYRAQILAQAGGTDAALDEIEHLLTTPSLVSVHTLRLDPLWDPLRSNRRFQTLLAKYQNLSRN